MSILTDFINTPINFLSDRPLIVSIPPDFFTGPAPIHFNITESVYLHNTVPSMLPNTPCELTVDQTNTSILTAYYCNYSPDVATRLVVGQAADFMFTANMNGCTFLVGHTNGQYIVSHSNAAETGYTVYQNTGSRKWGRLIQKVIQEVRGKKILQIPNPKIKHSCSLDSTTVVGIRNITTGSWQFWRQINTVNAMGDGVTVKSLDLF